MYADIWSLSYTSRPTALKRLNLNKKLHCRLCFMSLRFVTVSFCPESKNRDLGPNSVPDHSNSNISSHNTCLNVFLLPLLNLGKLLWISCQIFLRNSQVYQLDFWFESVVCLILYSSDDSILQQRCWPDDACRCSSVSWLINEGCQTTVQWIRQKRI